MNMKIGGLPPGSAARLLFRRGKLPDGRLHVFLCLCDHFEPRWRNPPRFVQDSRVCRWVCNLPELAKRFADSAGQPPRHTFFYPGDEYDARHVEQVAGICRQGFGEIEVHLHHRNDTAETLREKLESFVHTLHHRHGALRRGPDGRIEYAFIHGNWALANSHPRGDWCGVNDEITVLRQTGCYADFTMPSAPGPCQTRIVNRIYYAQGSAARPKSHDTGVPAAVGAVPPADRLLMIQGPLAFDWSSRKWGVLPRLENGDLTGRRPPSMRRFRLWCNAGVRVRGQDRWLFVKLHTHGAQEANAEMLLGQPMRQFHQELQRLAEFNPLLRYYYVTARQMAGLVHQAELGIDQPDVAACDDTATRARLGNPAAAGVR